MLMVWPSAVMYPFIRTFGFSYTPCMKLLEAVQRIAESVKSEPQNIEYRTAEFRRVVSLRSIFLKIDRIHHFDIRYS